MNDDIKKSQSKKVEQLIIERPIKYHQATGVTLIDDQSITIYAAKEWTDVITKRQTYKLQNLIEDGYRVVSITKAFIASGDSYACFGVETAILEREI